MTADLFYFKKFFVNHENCTLKVGTDAVLLGSWTEVQDAKKILDIGTGAGILALMMAQKSNADVIVDAVEIDLSSAQMAHHNFMNSPWKKNLSVTHMDIRDFAPARLKYYDLIICNPPFFEDCLRSNDNKNNLAKHNTKLNYRQLIESVNKLLKNDARFVVIIPYDRMDNLYSLCIETQLVHTKNTLVVPVEGKKPNRVMMEWTKTNEFLDCKQNMLCVRDRNNVYTEDYLKLTKDFLLFSHNGKHKKY